MLTSVGESEREEAFIIQVFPMPAERRREQIYLPAFLASMRYLAA